MPPRFSNMPFVSITTWNMNNLKMASDWNLLMLVYHRVLVRSDLEAHRVLVISG